MKSVLIAIRFGTSVSLLRWVPACGFWSVGTAAPDALNSALNENGGLTKAFCSAMPTSVRSKYMP